MAKPVRVISKTADMPCQLVAIYTTTEEALFSWIKVQRVLENFQYTYIKKKERKQRKKKQRIETETEQMGNLYRKRKKNENRRKEEERGQLILILLVAYMKFLGTN